MEGGRNPRRSALQYNQDINRDDDIVTGARGENLIAPESSLMFSTTPIPVPFETSGLPAILVIAGAAAISHSKGKGKKNRQDH